MNRPIRVVRVLCAVLLAVSTFCLGTITSDVPSAVAGGRPYIGTSSADMFWCTSAQDFCANHPFAQIAQGTPLTLVCWVDDRAPYSGSSPRWFYSLLDNGQEGYVWAPQVYNQTPNTPWCPSVNWLNVSNWAIGHLGQTAYLSGDGPYQPPISGSPPARYWSGYCTTFVYDAWSQWGGVPAPTNSSTYPGDVWNWFLRNDPSNVHLESNGVTRPPRGALVFWASTDPHLWHVAISLGNWQAVGTQHAGSPNYISQYGIYAAGYTGWIMPQPPTVPQNPS